MAEYEVLGRQCTNCGARLVVNTEGRCMKCNIKVPAAFLSAASRHVEHKKQTEPGSGEVTYVNTRPEEAVVAWLIRHTEGKTTVCYSLYAGVNAIGRRSITFGTPEVSIEDDDYVGRDHASCFIRKNEYGTMEVHLRDSGLKTGKPSLNGTYVNGRKERLRKGESYQLSDGDTIQIGETKLVFHVAKSQRTAEQMVTGISAKPYVPTVRVGQPR